MRQCVTPHARREGEAGRPGSAAARNAAAAGPVRHEGSYVAFLAAHDLEASDSDDDSFRRASCSFLLCCMHKGLSVSPAGPRRRTIMQLWQCSKSSLQLQAQCAGKSC